MVEETRLFAGDDGAHRCWWCAATADYQQYHDHEWGFPVVDDRRLFEKICLEGFQSGLSWLTILRKREAFRQAFANFEPTQVAGFGEADVARMLADVGIVRHRGKIESAINNARRACALREEKGSLAAYFWQFEPAPGRRSTRFTPADLVNTSAESEALARDLKRRGWSFVGPTTAYAFMQAMGLVNDHLDGCHVREAALGARRSLVLPS